MFSDDATQVKAAMLALTLPALKEHSDALARGLVDELGSYDDAVKAAAELANFVWDWRKR